jgi:1-acyl-sn-glycerol-3-phosphate acyltransferase
MSWRHPGRFGALLYALAAFFVSGIVATVARLRLAKRRGRRRAAEKLPDGPIIVISNHASYADGALLALVCRRMGRSVRLLASAGVFRAPVLGGLVTRLGFIPVERGSDRAADSLQPAVTALAAGEAVGIFPEGRTTRDPDHWPERAKTGAVRLALLTGAPIVPVAMVGTHRVLGREHVMRSMVTNVILRPKVLVDVGEPIDVRALAPSEEPSAEEVRELADVVMARLITLVGALRDEAAPHPTGVVSAAQQQEAEARPSRW